MSVVVLEILEENPHPNADALRVYRVGGPSRDSIVVVADLSVRYSPGDRVAVALVGAELKNGTKIKMARLRGVDSFGMLLGRHEAAVGSDVTAEFCDVVPAGAGPGVVNWPSIELLHNVRTGVRAIAEIQGKPLPKIRYRAKVKLDGTNAGVQVHPDGRVIAQSRTQTLDPQNDNLGFAAWVARHRDYFSALKQSELLVIFGEWCGQGIQKRAAISKIDRKVFVVFATQVGDGERVAPRLVTEPAALRTLLPEHPDVFVLPWQDEVFELDFGNDDALRAAAASVSEAVARVEAEDPFVARTFGVHGLGEGLVLYPMLGGETDDRKELVELIFKAKGEKHQTVRQKQPAQIDPEKSRGIDEFVELVVTEARLEQAVTEACGGAFESARVGAFLKWMATDVQKECSAELERSGLSWADVNRAVSNKSRTWFLEKVRAF
jgi:tRNA-binding EMAP/Myf-like protein